MKGVDEKKKDVKKRLSNISMDVITAAAAAAAATAVSGGTTTSRTTPLQQAFGGLDFLEQT